MKKAIYLFVLSMVTLFGVTIYSNSQFANKNGRELSGKLVESNEQIIDNALVTVKEGEKVIAQTNVEKDGMFKFENLPKKVLNLSIENVAYNTVYKTIDLVNASSINFGDILLDTHVNILEEMIILVKR